MFLMGEINMQQSKYGCSLNAAIIFSEDRLKCILIGYSKRSLK